MSRSDTLPAPDTATLTSASRTSLFVMLWLIWAALLAAAMVLGNMDGMRSPATVTRMGSSVALVITGCIAYAIWRHSPAGRYAWWIALGMALGTVGDFFNANLLTFIPLKEPVIGVILSFGLGHFAYIIGIVGLGRLAGLRDRRAMILAVIAWQIVGLVGWYYVAWLGEKNRDVVWPALPYSLLLAGTAGVASGLALQERRLTGLALGGALFLASDLILAVGMFRGSFRHQSEAVWLTYGPGQMLIVFSILSAVAILASWTAASVRAAERG